MGAFAPSQIESAKAIHANGQRTQSAGAPLYVRAAAPLGGQGAVGLKSASDILISVVLILVISRQIHLRVVSGMQL